MSDEAVAKPDVLRGKLEKALAHRFDAMELPIHGMRVILNGQLNESLLDIYVSLLSQYPLKYTMHAPFSINLFDRVDGERHFELLMQSIRVCSAVGAETLVYHPGRYVTEEMLAYRNFWPQYSEADKQRLLERERNWMRQAGDEAKKVGLRIGMENMRPYLDNPDYCYSTDPIALAEQVEQIGHPSVGVTLDVGHLHLAMKDLPYSLEEAVERLRPHIVHMHLHDNFGRPSFSLEKNQFDMVPIGRGDMHMPIGFGDVPMERIARELGSQIDGYLIHEIRAMYEEEWPRLQQSLLTAEQWITV